MFSSFFGYGFCWWVGNNVGHQRLSNNIKRKGKKTTLSLSIIFNYTFIHIFWFCNIKHSARWVFVFFFKRKHFFKKSWCCRWEIGLWHFADFFIIYRSGSHFKKKEWRTYWDEEPRENNINRSVIFWDGKKKTKRTNWLQFMFLLIFSRIFKKLIAGQRSRYSYYYLFALSCCIYFNVGWVSWFIE